MNIFKSFVSLKINLKLCFVYPRRLKTTNITYQTNFYDLYPVRILLHYGLSVYSQNDEDGIIQAIFNKIGIQRLRLWNLC